MPPDVAEVKRWLEKADRDRRLAQAALLQVPPITDGAGFHCQQSVEKLFKAFLVCHGQPFERIHDLRMLASLCSRIDPDFADVAIEVAPLTSFAVRFRYPGPVEPTADEAERALVIVGRTWEFVLARLPGEVRS